MEQESNVAIVEENLTPSLDEQLEINELAEQQLKDQAVEKGKYETVIHEGKVIEPICSWYNTEQNMCAKEASHLFKDFLSQKEQLLCQKHLSEKEALYKTGNNAYEVKPLLTANKEDTGKKEKGKKSKK